MFERVEACPVCGKTEFRDQLTVADKSVSGEKFVIQQCAACGFQLTNPRPSEAEIGKYYESDEYVSHNSGAAGLVNQVYKVARFFTVRRKVALLNKLVPRPGKLLDYGCGTGHFLAAAQGAGWQVQGLEPNARAREEATRRVGRPIGNESLVLFEPGTFAAITLWHVLEHVHALNETLRRLTRLLRPDGVLLIAVPNAASFDAHRYQENWAAYDVPRHLYHFTPATMTRLLGNHHLRVRQTLPLPLDAYYVSLLSEQYRGSGAGRLAVLRAGYQSNRHAARHDGQYSSLIYVAEKA